MITPTDQWQIESDGDDEAAYAALAQDRLWNGYSIADLVPPFRAYARVALAWRSGEPAAAACLILRHPAFNAVIPHGDPCGIAAILATLDLPERAYVLARAPHLASLERHYAFPNAPKEMLRMAVDRATFSPPAGWESIVEPLGPDDLPALLGLYATYGASLFNPDQLSGGPFYGVREGGELVAAGGTHVVAARYGIGAIGSVYTRPDARGQGYGSAVTAAVVADLLAGPCRDVILNVAAANEAARRIYVRLGFRVHCGYREGEAVLRQAAWFWRQTRLPSMSGIQRADEAAPSELDHLAEYFDRTDAGELPWDEATDLAIERPELEQISLRLPKADLAHLRARAARAGVGYTTLIRMIVRQYVQNPLTF